MRRPKPLAYIVLKLTALTMLLALELWKLFWLYPHEMRERHEHERYMQTLERRLADMKDVHYPPDPSLIWSLPATFTGQTAPIFQRDAHGRIKRSSAVRRHFEREHPCPATGMRTGACPGYVVDHIVPLECNGRDAVENLQWQTRADAKAKDRTERYCGAVKVGSE